MTACSVIERRDHRLAASKNGCVELQNKFTSHKIYGIIYIKRKAHYLYQIPYTELFMKKAHNLMTYAVKRMTETVTLFTELLTSLWGDKIQSL